VSEEEAVTSGTLLGGKVAYIQYADGYRTGLEPVLLAAAVPARTGQRVLEAGSGAGAGLLCLAWRLNGIVGIGVERNPDLVALAQRNAAANASAGGLEFRPGAIESFALEKGALPFDHAFANPPWHHRSGTAPATVARTEAKCAATGLLDAWVAAMVRCLRHRGTLSLILPAADTGVGVAALAGSGLGGIALIPIWPRHGQPARLVVLRGRRGVRGGCTMHAGLVLHGPGSSFTDAAQRVLRDGAGLAQG
jgi:tRNA1(Val) A37 N6-methylase TrmN6